MIFGDGIITNRNDFTYDVEIYDYKTVKTYLGVFVRGGLYMNIIEGVGLTTSVYGRTNLTPIVIDNSFMYNCCGHWCLRRHHVTLANTIQKPQNETTTPLQRHALPPPPARQKAAAMRSRRHLPAS